MRTAARLGFYALLALLLSLIVATRMAPALAGVIPVSLTGQSMTGSYEMGSLIYISPEMTPSTGDAISFARNGKIWTHRIIEVTNTIWSFDDIAYRTKGDAVDQPDDFLVLPSQVHGVVVAQIPYAGYAVLFAQQPPAWLFVLTLAFGLWIIAQPETDREKALKRMKKNPEDYKKRLAKYT